MKKAFLFVFCLVNASLLYAQHEKIIEAGLKPNHGIAILLSHTHISEGFADVEKKWLVLSSWGFRL